MTFFYAFLNILLLRAISVYDICFHRIAISLVVASGHTFTHRTHYTGVVRLTVIAGAHIKKSDTFHTVHAYVIKATTVTSR